MRNWWGRISGIQRAGAVAAAVIVLGIIAAMGRHSGSSSSGKAAGTPTTPTTPATASSPASSPKATVSHRPASSHPAPGPTFVYPGDPECAITYRDRGDGSMSWTARLSVPGELITHAADAGGTIYRHDVHAAAGVTSFTAPVPLARITDIGGNLRGTGDRSYGCSIAPAK